MTPEDLRQSACRDASADLFFPPDPPRGRNAISEWRIVAAPALNLCAVCPVTAPCLAAALADGELGGVRGGKTPPELRQLAGKQRGTRPTRRQHGTDGGYRTHLRRGEEACAACLDAHMEHNRRWRVRREPA